MKAVLIFLMVLFSAGAMAGGKCEGGKSHGHGGDAGGTNFGHCRGAGCFK